MTRILLMDHTSPELLVVMPVYNESASIGIVVNDWFTELKRHTSDFIMLVIDDGSRDDTPRILSDLQTTLGSKLEIISRENRGHGQSCMQGYRTAKERGIPFVFQIDSDGQCDPLYFASFWANRDSHDVIYGVRTREDGIRRIIASAFLKALLLVCCRTYCVDPNVPYRLMRVSACGPAFGLIPDRFFLANVALAVVLKRMKHIRQGAVPIRFRQRHGGEPSVPFSKFAVRAFELACQLKGIHRPINTGE